MNRVTDTCIPSTVMQHIEKALSVYWKEAADKNESYFPHEYIFRLIKDGVVDSVAQVPRENSWVIAACETGIPIYSPGIEDSTLGNMFTADVILGKVNSHRALKSGTEQFEHLIKWYQENSKDNEIGFFQIGGGIAGDFPICSVPTIIDDLEQPCKFWGYFCQISDAITSYGGYSGAVPNEKITWWKLSKECPKFMIQSDATIVAPLVFQYVLEKGGESMRIREYENTKEKVGTGA